MNLAIILCHNKTDAENAAQITALRNLLTEVRIPVFDDEGNPIVEPNTLEQKTAFSHYTINDLDIPHEVHVYQIVPFQPDNKSDPYESIKPENLDELYSHNVYYGKGDEDKIDDHPRFFNWGLKRSTDYGADISFYVEDISKLMVEDLAFELSTLADPDDKMELIEEQAGKFVTLKLLSEVGQLKEDRIFSQAMIDLKSRVTQEGLEHG